MFDFIKEYSDFTGLPYNEMVDDYKLVLIGNKCISITNYIRILYYNKEKIIIKIKNNSLNIEGISLIIKMLEKKEIIIAGEINKIYLSKEFTYEKK